MKNQQHTKVLLSLATAPFLIGVIASRELLQNLIDLGKTSEEVFRGERLPLLDFPPANPTNQ